ncbi:MAG: metallophosphoesterase family protein [Chloroflexi bacterium]|nr:metallophosphoesterase family protein [Chloroflexota bacterium]
MTPRTTTFGLISDTHIPDRWRALPPSVFDIFDGVDLVLHAGDVGDLDVIDQLSSIAPVVAVHGNDECATATDVLPFQQMITAPNHRILLTHGHHPDRAQELALRKIDDWTPKLDRLADMAHAVDASILVYGHTHIGWAIHHDGVWIINPGAIASGNYSMRQKLQTVARLTLAADRDPVVNYFDITHPGQPIERPVDLAAGFRAAFDTISESLVTDDLRANISWFADHVYAQAPEQVFPILRQLMFRSLDNGHARIRITDLVDELLQSPNIPGAIKTHVQDTWG